MAEQPYTEVAPPADLAAYVDRFWWRTSRGAAAGRLQRVLPDGCVDVLIHVDRERAELVGTMTRALVLPDGPTEVVAVRFRPGTAAALARCALAELTDHEAGLAELGLADDGLVERVAAARPAQRIAIVIAWLRARLAGARVPDRQIARAVALLSAGARVERACNELGVTRQHLARAFRREVGVTPKQLARIARMQRATAALDGRGLHPAGSAAGGPRGSIARLPLARLAAELGYADQAHLGNELRALSGATPRELAEAPPLTLRHLYAVPFLQGRARRAP